MTVDSQTAPSQRTPAGPTLSLGRDRTGGVLPTLGRRFLRPSTRPAGGWLLPCIIALLAFGIRVWRLSEPKHLIFDETYYAKDAYSLLRHGYVRDFAENADAKIAAGEFDGLMKAEPNQIVHPDGGKWLIALGEHAFGLTPFGWRIAVAVVGALTVLILARLVLRLTGSVPLACVGGLLLCFDGLHFVLSRTALLDVILAFWLVSGVACLVVDRDWGRARLARRFPVSTDITGFGPVRALLFRPWRLAAGVCLGMACGTKWSALYVIAAFGIVVFCWDLAARRAIGVRDAVLKSVLVDGIPAFLSIVGVAFLVYLATWTGWLIHHDLYARQFGSGMGDTAPWGAYVDDEPSGLFGEAMQALRSLWNYHQLIYGFHTGDYLAGKTHPYGSHPRGWLLLNRPVSMSTQTELPLATAGCDPRDDDGCVRQVLALGNPVIWWAATAAMIGSVWQWLGRRDWRFAIPVLGVAATWLPWFGYDDRPIFSFYTVATVPFAIIGLTLLLGRLIGPDASPRRRRWGTVAIGLYVALAIACFTYFYPILAYEEISNGTWNRLIWFQRWI